MIFLPFFLSQHRERKKKAKPENFSALLLTIQISFKKNMNCYEKAKKKGSKRQ